MQTAVSEFGKAQSFEGVYDVHRAQPMDYDEIARIHVESFPGFYLTSLGRPFLKRYYALVRDYDQGCLLVATAGTEVAGFVAGFRSPAQFYGRMTSLKWRFVLPIAWSLLWRPRLFAGTFKNVLRVRALQHHVEWDEHCCELSSIAVAPRHSGKGIGAWLVREFVELNRQQGARRVFLSTDAENNAAVNTFYQRLGFQCVRIYDSGAGRMKREYEMFLGDPT